MADSPSYYAIIPANVRYDHDLCANAKLLYGEITALAQSSGKCFASNDYFAKLYGVSKASITKWVKQLCEKGYIQSELVYKQGTKEILHRYLTLVVYPTQEKLSTPTKEKLSDNNTSINNTRLNTDASLISKFKEETNAGEVAIKLATWFIQYRKTIKKPIKTISPLVNLIMVMRECINAGYKIEEVKELIKVKEWQSVRLEWVQKELKAEKGWSV